MQVVSRGTIDKAVEEFERSGVIARLFHVEQLPALAQILSVSRQRGKGSATFVWRVEAVPIKIGRFVPRGTQTASFRLDLGASDPRDGKLRATKEKIP